MLRFLDYGYIAATICFTVYGQMILKWRIGQFGPLPSDPFSKLKFLVLLLFDPMIFSGFAAGFLASLAWMAAMTKFPLNHAYPFMSLNFVVVGVLSYWILNEPISLQKCTGLGLIVLGTILAARG
jgi:multidrug transporter EmrE-like cation transporter